MKYNKITNRLKFICETEMEKYRCDTFWDKEPETINWLKSFKTNSVFYDVGANVGVYSLYAASLYPKIKIFAFEPVYDNFQRLRENISLNKRSSITPLPIAVGDKTRLADFFIINNEIATSGSQLDQPITEYHKKYQPVDTYKVLCMSLDSFANLAPAPDYIKIDIDGLELDVIKGMNKIVRQVKSVLIEVNKDVTSRDRLCRWFAKHGLTDKNKFNKFKPHSSERRGGNPENIIFTKK